MFFHPISTYRNVYSTLTLTLIRTLNPLDKFIRIALNRIFPLPTIPK